MGPSRSSNRKRRAVALAAVLCLATASVVGANYPLIDSVTVPAQPCKFGAGVTAFTWTHTVGPGPNRELVIVVFSPDDGALAPATPTWSLGSDAQSMLDGFGGGVGTFFFTMSLMTPTTGTGTIRVSSLTPAKSYMFLSISFTGVAPGASFQSHDEQSQVNGTVFTETFVPGVLLTGSPPESQIAHLDVGGSGTSGAVSVPSSGGGPRVLLNSRVCGLTTKFATASYAPPTVSPFTWTNGVVQGNWSTSTFDMVNKGQAAGPVAGGSGQFLPAQSVGQ